MFEWNDDSLQPLESSSLEVYQEPFFKQLSPKSTSTRAFVFRSSILTDSISQCGSFEYLAGGPQIKEDDLEHSVCLVMMMMIY